MKREFTSLLKKTTIHLVKNDIIDLKGHAGCLGREK